MLITPCRVGRLFFQGAAFTRTGVEDHMDKLNSVLLSINLNLSELIGVALGKMNCPPML